MKFSPESGLRCTVEPLEPRTLLAATLFAGIASTGDTVPGGVTTDPEGNVFLTGRFNGTIDLDPSPTATATLTAVGDGDVYLAKYSPAGALLWSRQWSPSGGEALGEPVVTTDASGNVYVAGAFASDLDADPTRGTFALRRRYSHDNLFLVGLDADGDFRTANRMATRRMDMDAVSLKADAAGHVYLLASSLIPERTWVDEFKIDTVLYQFRSNGRALRDYRWSTRADVGVVIPHDMAVTPAGDVYIVGDGSDTVDYQPGRGVHRIDGGVNHQNDFLLRLTPSGHLAYALSLEYGESPAPTFRAVAVDDQGNAYVTGFANDTVDFNPSRRKRHLLGPPAARPQAAFVVRYAPDARLLGTSNISEQVQNAMPSGLAIDRPTGDVLVVGGHNPPDNTQGVVPGHLQAKDGTGLFLTRYTPDLAFVGALGAASISSDSRFSSSPPFVAPVPTGGFYVIALATRDTLELYPTTPATTYDLPGRTFILKLE